MQQIISLNAGVSFNKTPQFKYDKISDHAMYCGKFSKSHGSSIYLPSGALELSSIMSNLKGLKQSLWNSAYYKSYHERILNVETLENKIVSHDFILHFYSEKLQFVSSILTDLV